jgi:hypothetical protein
MVIVVTMAMAVLIFPLLGLVFAMLALTIELRLLLVFEAAFALETRLALALDPTLAFYPGFAFALDLPLTFYPGPRVPGAVIAIRADGLNVTIPVGHLLALASVVDHLSVADHATVVHDLTVRGVDTALIVVNPIAKHSLLRRPRPDGRLAHWVAVRRIR